MRLDNGPHIVSRETELLERIADLEDQVAELRALLAVDQDVMALRDLGFQAAEARIVNTLLARESVSREMVAFAVWPNDTEKRLEFEPKSADIHICHIRRKLRPFSATLEAIWGFGWRMPPESKAAIVARMPFAAR